MQIFFTQKERIGKKAFPRELSGVRCCTPVKNWCRSYLRGWSPLPEFGPAYSAGTAGHAGITEPASLLVNFCGSLGFYKDTTRGNTLQHTATSVLQFLRRTVRGGANSKVGIVGDTEPVSDHAGAGFAHGMRRTFGCKVTVARVHRSICGVDGC